MGWLIGIIRRGGGPNKKGRHEGKGYKIGGSKKERIIKKIIIECITK
jgi:hypothetical protein